MKDIVLALGGGGVKGFAHIGVLRVLEREGYRIRAIAGTSAGGMIGAGYAAGHSPDDLERCMDGVDQSRLYGRLAGDGPSMLGLSGVIEILKKLLQERTFADTRIPLAVTAVNIDSAQLLAIRRGKLIDAVLASIALPGIFPPRQWEGMRLIDGGILDPVPVGLARYLAPRLPVIAVVLSPPMSDWSKPRRPRLFDSLPFLSNYVSQLRLAQSLNIFLRSIDIAGVELTELRLSVDRPEVIIRPAVPHIGILDRISIPEVIRLGEVAAEEALPFIAQASGWVSVLARRNPLSRPRPIYSWKGEC